MSIVAELTIPANQFALGETLEKCPDVDVEFERIVTHSQEWVMPFLWARGDDLDAFQRALAEDGTVAEATLSDCFDEGVHLYEIQWGERVTESINKIFDMTGALVEAVGNDDRWEVTVRFDGRGSLSTIQSHFESDDTAFTLQRIYTPTSPRQPEYGLSSAQRDTLVRAVERGHFDIPRRATLSDVAGELDVSTAAASENLRRAVTTLTRNTLTIDGEIPHDRDGS